MYNIYSKIYTYFFCLLCKEVYSCLRDLLCITYQHNLHVNCVCAYIKTEIKFFYYTNSVILYLELTF